MADQEVAIRGDKELALYELETRFEMASRQRELLEKYIGERLHPGKHFYKIGDDPGRKPSLTKEGAELICLPHALKAHYEWLFGPQAPPMDNTPYQITIKCEFEASGKFAGEGIGSASSYITKKDGSYKPRQNDPGLCHNATVKMASKSAYIAATLNATAASEFFTQDLEDMAEPPEADGKKTEPPNEKHPYWCKEHKVVWFKSKNMRGYAHPIAGSGDPPQWCNMPVPKAEAKAAPVEDFTDTDDMADEAQAALVKPEAKTEPEAKPTPIMQLRTDLLEAMKPLTKEQKASVLASDPEPNQGRWTHTNYRKAIDKALELSKPKPAPEKTERMV